MSNSKQCHCGVKMLCCGCNKGPYVSNGGDRYNCVNTKIVKNERNVYHFVFSDNSDKGYRIPLPQSLPVLQTDALDKGSIVQVFDHLAGLTASVKVDTEINILRKFTVNNGETVKSYLFIPIIYDTPRMHTPVYEKVEVAKTRWHGTFYRDRYRSNHFCYDNGLRCYGWPAMCCIPDRLLNDHDTWLNQMTQDDLDLVNERYWTRGNYGDLIHHNTTASITNVGFFEWFLFIYAWNKYPPNPATDWPWLEPGVGKTPMIFFAFLAEILSETVDYRVPIYIDIPEKSPDKVVYGLYKEIGNEEIDFTIDYDTLHTMKVGEIRTTYKRHVFKEVDNRNFPWAIGSGFNSYSYYASFFADCSNFGYTAGYNQGYFDITQGSYPDLGEDWRQKLSELLSDKDIKLVHNDTDVIDYNNMDMLCKARIYNDGLVAEGDWMTTVNNGRFFDYDTQYGYFDQEITTIQDSAIDLGVKIVRDGEKTYLLIKDLLPTPEVISDTGSWEVTRVQTVHQNAIIATHIETADNNLMIEGIAGNSSPCYRYQPNDLIELSDYQVSVYKKTVQQKISYPMIGPVEESHRPVSETLNGDKAIISCYFMRTSDAIINGWGGDDTVLFCPHNAKVGCANGSPAHSILNLEEGRSETDMMIIIHNRLNKLTELTASSILKSGAKDFDITNYQDKNDTNIHDLTNYELGGTFNFPISDSEGGIKCESNPCYGIGYNIYEPNTINLKSSISDVNEQHKVLMENLRRNFTPVLEFNATKLKGNTNTGRFLDLSFAVSEDNVDNGTDGVYSMIEHHLSFDAIETEYLADLNPCYNTEGLFVAEGGTAVKKGNNYYPKQYRVSTYITNYNSGINENVSTEILNYNEDTDSWSGTIPLTVLGNYLGPYVSFFYWQETLSPGLTPELFTDIFGSSYWVYFYYWPTYGNFYYSAYGNYYQGYMGNKITIPDFGYTLDVSMTIDDDENIKLTYNGTSAELVESNRCNLAIYGMSFNLTLPTVSNIYTDPVVMNRPAMFILSPNYFYNTRRKMAYSSDVLFTYNPHQGEDPCYR